jgi:uncharacterized membrane protein (UPF0127 family)
MVSIISERIQKVIICILAVVGIVFMYNNREYLEVPKFDDIDQGVMYVNDITVRVDIADTEAERVQGLSGKKAIKEVDGLLFVFPESDFHSIWMKDMNFPIDIIWIDENLKVVGIEKGVTPDTYPRAFRPSRPVKYILETNVHFSDTYSFKAGHEVQLPSQFDLKNISAN